MDQVFEKLGVFYLGKVQEPDADKLSDYLLYDAKDLTTHALCVGMTGSGKTGLCISLLEEAGIDGIPAIVVDPKGDLGNLLLTFPELKPDDFRPWIDETEAARQGMTADQYASQVADTWRKGLEEWEQDGDRIARLKSSVDMAIYTPGSSVGTPLTVLKSFAAPPEAVLSDVDAFRERIAASTAGVLALLGLDIDPVQSREFILISNLLSHAWSEKRDMDIAGLIHEIQTPPFDQIGVMDLDTFYPAKDRLKLAMTLNSLLASPSFASWLEGEPLDIQRLLYTDSGKPRISILSIAHLPDSERMFFVTILLNELLTWVRTQAGTPSLRALFYMDEVFGYFPPTANPPSKQPMLTLLKQARAYGLGLVLATQNPVDLDYKGLSNCGTWFLGRLQTERDKMRVLDGLESASSQSAGGFDRQEIDKVLSGLDGREFVLNNVHEDGPVIFHTRWAMSYLRGPLTRSQIQTLTANTQPPSEQEPAVESEPSLEPGPQSGPVVLEPAAPSETTAVTKPDAGGQIPDDVPQRFLAVCRQQPEETRLVYRPSLFGNGSLHFIRVTYHVDCWEERSVLTRPSDSVSSMPWSNAAAVAKRDLVLQEAPEPHGVLAKLPNALAEEENYGIWEKKLKDYLYRTERIEILHSDRLKEYSKPGESKRDFRIRLTQLAHEKRDLQVEALRDRYRSKITSLNRQIQRAKQMLQREKSEYSQRKVDAVVSVGSSILGALFGRKVFSRKNVEKASSSAKTIGRTSRERDDVARAKESLQSLKSRLAELELKVSHDVAEIDEKWQPDRIELDQLTVKSRKASSEIDPVMVVWTPWFVDEDSNATRAF